MEFEFRQNKKYASRPTARRAFALVTVLVILTLLSVIVTAFLTSTAAERATARAFCNATRADLAASSATSDGATLLKACFETYPDSATTWEPVWCSGSAVTAGTVLYFRSHPNGAAFDPANDPVSLRPLMSGGTAVALTGSQAAPAKGRSTLAVAYPSLPFTHPDNSVDLNYPRFAGDTIGWIGSSGTGRLSVCVPWIYQTETTGTGARPVARYAYWIEDESFKINTDCSGKDPRGTDTAGDSPAQIPLQGLLAASGSLPASDGEAAGIVNVRNSFPGRRFGDFRALNQVCTIPNFAETAKFEGTAYSSSLNLSRSGARRLNLNAVVQDSTDADAIRRQLDWAIAPIRIQLPNFGQRFYRLDPKSLNDLQVPTIRSMPSADCTETYLQKIAANLRDYIDPDSQPTIVNNDADMTIRLGKPTTAIEPLQSGTQGDNSVLAVGKENVPYLDEYAIRVTLNGFSPAFMTGTTNKGATYDFDLDYYFEFWNMTGVDIHAGDLGPNPFLRVYNQAAWDTGGGTSIPEGRAFDVPIPSTAVFPAGSATVITTDPNPNRKLLGSAISSVIVAPVANDSDRHYTGTTYKTSTVDFGYRVNLIGRAPGGATGVTLGATDYETRMLLGNDNGLLESMNALPIARTGGNASKEAISIQNDAGDTIGSEDYFVRGGSLRSGPAPSEYADPRTNNEQLYMRAYVKNGDADQTRYFNTGLDDAIVPAQSSLGQLNFKADAAFSGSVDATQWPDCSSETPTPTTNCAPMAVANAPMKSVGELGHIFDPVRGLGSYTGAQIGYSRGGGRTLTVGQPDPLWDKNSASPSREWTAWRLADLYCTTDDLFLDGRINLNGVLRDNGAALRALLYGYSFSNGADADPAIASQWLTSQATDELVAELKERLANSGTFSGTLGPLAERGELSELPLFASGSILTGTNAAALYDRGREEVFRRVVELTTTRGCIFSIYTVGQALQQTPTGQKLVTGTCRRRTIVQLAPVWTPPLPADSSLSDADATDPEVAAARFRPPDAYQIRVLQVKTE